MCVVVLFLREVGIVHDCLSSRRRHTICALVTGVHTCALPISSLLVVEGKGAASYTNGGGGQTTGGWRRCCGRPEPKGTKGVESTSYTRDRTNQGRTRDRKSTRLNSSH